MSNEIFKYVGKTIVCDFFSTYKTLFVYAKDEENRRIECHETPHKLYSKKRIKGTKVK